MSTDPEEPDDDVEPDDDAGEPEGEPEEVEHNSVEEFDEAVEDAIYGGG